MLLAALETPDAPDWMKTLPAVTTLRNSLSQESRGDGGAHNQPCPRLSSSYALEPSVETSPASPSTVMRWPL